MQANRAALESAVESSAAAVAGTRPWIELKVESDGSLEVAADGSSRLTVRTSYKNIGKTPAVDCQLHVIAVGDGSGGIMAADIKERYGSVVRRGSHMGHTVFPNAEEKHAGPFPIKLVPDANGRAFTLLIFVVTYRLAGQRTWMATPFVRHLIEEGEELAVVSVTPGEHRVHLGRVFDYGLEPT